MSMRVQMSFHYNQVVDFIEDESVCDDDYNNYDYDSGMDSDMEEEEVCKRLLGNCRRLVKYIYIL